MSITDFAHFGNIHDPGGSIIVMKNLEGVKKAYKFILSTMFQSRGIPLTVPMKIFIAKEAEKFTDEIHQGLREKGVPVMFSELFSIMKKSEVKKYCKGLLITKEDLARLVYNADKIGYNRKSEHYQFIPEQLKLETKDYEVLKKNTSSNDAIKKKKVISKIENTFDERKVNNCHLFEKGEEWHCLYFSYKDCRGKDHKHWSGGDHLHYVSHLWPNLDKESVWNGFKKRSFKSLGGLHIRFEYK